MEKFYAIKLIKGNGERGYIIDHGEDKPVQMSVGSFVADCAQFPSYQAAQKFIRERRLEKGKNKAYIRDNEDIIKEVASGDTLGMSPINAETYYAENLAGEKMFYDKNKKEYYFKKAEVGYPVWSNKQELVDGLKKMNWPFDVHVKLHSVNNSKKQEA